MVNDMIKDFLEGDISIYTDLLIQNEEWIDYHIKRRMRLKDKLDLLEKQLHDHLKHLEEYEVGP